mmetsp:Transcript_8269/g.21161  ORF Transcript_8269/g.21161 Transcript_8269/m.21161 type:complete len:242 (-) Transcript_8269:420-1145(-)
MKSSMCVCATGSGSAVSAAKRWRCKIKVLALGQARLHQSPGRVQLGPSRGGLRGVRSVRREEQVHTVRAPLEACCAEELLDGRGGDARELHAARVDARRIHRARGRAERVVQVYPQRAQRQPVRVADGSASLGALGLHASNDALQRLRQVRVLLAARREVAVALAREGYPRGEALVVAGQAALRADTGSGGLAFNLPAFCAYQLARGRSRGLHAQPRVPAAKAHGESQQQSEEHEPAGDGQ